MNAFRHLFILILLFGCTVWVHPQPSFAKESTKETLKKKEAKVKKRVQIIKRLDKRITHLDTEIISLEKELKAAQKSLTELEINEAKERQKLEEVLSHLSILAREIVRMERMPTDVMSFFSEETLKETHQRQGIITQSRESLAQAIKKQKAQIYTLQDLRLQKEKTSTDILHKQKTLSQHRQKLQKLFDKQVGWLKSDDAEKASLLKSARSKAAKAKNLEELAGLVDQTESTHAAITPRYAKKLPVNGHVTHYYGDKNSVGVKAQGMTIETTVSEPVKALSDGRIIYSDRFREYKHIIILEHPDGIHSVYSGLEKSTLNVGDYVRAMHSLGNMPHEQSPELYLELRKNGRTLDPIRWLKRQK